jgi:hypothetical protein
LENYQRAAAAGKHRRQVRIDFTLTLPGMFEVENIVRLAKDTDTDILAKVIFSFTPDIVMSPLALPRELLDLWVNELVSQCPAGAMQDVLAQLKNRPTFAEQWPDTYLAGLAKGKARVLELENIRPSNTTMNSILNARPEIKKWWNEIA